MFKPIYLNFPKSKETIQYKLLVDLFFEGYEPITKKVVININPVIETRLVYKFKK